MHRGLIAALMLVAALVPDMALAQGFDVEQATRAYLDLVHGPARLKSDAYFEGGNWLILWSTVVGVLVYWAMLASGLSARLRDWAVARTRRQTVAVMLYASGFALVSTLLMLPWTIYADFIHERQYDLMSQSFGMWMIDQAKSLVITVIVTALFFAVTFAAIRRAPRRWWLWGAGIAWSFLMISTAIAPVLVYPLFYNFSEMQAGPLRERIAGMARANAVPAEHIYVVDASRQSKRIAAAVSGMGPTAQIALTDSLLNRTSPDEVAAVMGHEIGHYALGHLWRRGIMLGLLILAMFFAVAKATPALVLRNPRWEVQSVADVAAAPALLLVGTIVFMLATPIANTIFRTVEAQADAFGLDAARSPDAFALVAIRLSEYRKLEPGPVEEFLFFDHPSGESRIRRSMQWKKDHVPAAVMVKPVLPS
jgi:STE24 endopeptidase